MEMIPSLFCKRRCPCSLFGQGREEGRERRAEEQRVDGEEGKKEEKSKGEGEEEEERRGEKRRGREERMTPSFFL